MPSARFAAFSPYELFIALATSYDDVHCDSTRSLRRPLRRPCYCAHDELSERKLHEYNLSTTLREHNRPFRWQKPPLVLQHHTAGAAVLASICHSNASVCVSSVAVVVTIAEAGVHGRELSQDEAAGCA
eukprot:1736765-Pleurochrysis_carterae.AAC.2